MITSLNIENFKSLNDFNLSFSSFNVLVGNNASGKSSVLHALDFLLRSVSEDFSSVIAQRGLTVSDIVSKLRPKRQIRFISEYTLFVNDENSHLRWELCIDVSGKENLMKLAFEQITDLDNDKILLSYDEDRKLCIEDGDGPKREYPMLSLNSSSLKIAVDVEKELKIQKLVALKRFLISSCSYDMLSPSEMRQSSRGRTTSIGTSGRDLAAFIKSMTNEQKESFMKTIHSLLGNKCFESVEAHTKGKPGWTTIEVVEIYGNKKVRISSKGMSDGMLRLLAFVAINEMDSESSLILLDEIENGINSNYAEKLIDLMQHSYDIKRRQIIVTTHSTAFLDYVDPENIIYLYRDEKTGFSKAVKLLDIGGMKERIEYMYPGEVFMNLSNADIMNVLMKREDRDDVD